MEALAPEFQRCFCGRFSAPAYVKAFSSPRSWGFTGGAGSAWRQRARYEFPPSGWETAFGARV
eukprot:325654-Lingulodinium_polyedra.AAC.1